VGMIALGSAQVHPDETAAKLLHQAESILVALDADDAGAKQAWQWWMKHFKQSRRWPPVGGKDPGDMRKAGVDVRTWVLAGLPGQDDSNGPGLDTLQKKGEDEEPQAPFPTRSGENPEPMRSDIVDAFEQPLSACILSNVQSGGPQSDEADTGDTNNQAAPTWGSLAQPQDPDVVEVPSTIPGIAETSSALIDLFASDSTPFPIPIGIDQNLEGGMNHVPPATIPEQACGSCLSFSANQLSPSSCRGTCMKIPPPGETLRLPEDGKDCQGYRDKAGTMIREHKLAVVLAPQGA
jgi:hypothetical protein